MTHFEKLPLSKTRNSEVDGCPSKENLFRQSVLLMNATTDGLGMLQHPRWSTFCN